MWGFNSSRYACICRYILILSADFELNLFFQVHFQASSNLRCFSELSVKFAHRLLVTIIDNEKGKFLRLNMAMVFKDKMFRSCVLVCASEIINVLFQAGVPINDVMGLLNVGKLELCMVIDLVLKSIGGLVIIRKV